MSKTVRNLIVISCILIAAGLILWIVWPKSISPAAAIGKVSEGVYAQAEGFSYVRNVNGRVEWEVRAKHVSYSENKQVADCKDIEAVFYAKKEGDVRLTAKTGRYFADTQDVEVEGDVRVVTTMGYTMVTDKAKFTQADRTIRTESPVFIKGKGLAMNSESMVFHLDDERIEFDGDVKSTLWNTKLLEEAKERIH